jgi:chromosome segregation ATPase
VSGNGPDIAAVYGLLREVAATVASHDRRFDRIDQRLDGLETRMDRLEARMDRLEARMDRLETRMDHLEARMDHLEGEVRSVRQTLVAYHSSVLGHGILISELEDRVRRIERHLDIPPAA